MRQLTSLDAQFLAAEDDRDIAPDAWPLIEHLTAELAELRNLVGSKTQRRSRTSTATTKIQGAPQ